jgi:hypoxanthine phosphoribosyltransferase
MRICVRKHYITAEQLLEDSFTLAWQVFSSGYRPTCIVGIWRGGSPVCIALQELLHLLGVESDHIPVRTSSYTGIAHREQEVRVDGLEYVTARCSAGDRLLLVDDVYDTGLSLQGVIARLGEHFGSDMPETRIATPWFKPGNNRTARNPDYFLHESDEWLVFPHELEGLSPEELREHKPALAPIIDELQSRLGRRR